MSSPPSKKKTTNAQLRKVAASKPLDALKAALAGWTASEINQAARKDGKNAVHLAAWHGSLENLQYLVEDFGCDMNVISTNDFSYGKTPIFFAVTRSRDDVVDYLLRRGALVKIVNNKGQTVLSISASHLSDSLVTSVQRQEDIQSDVEWLNFRESHSDGLEYGDLDPRFIDRPLRDFDVVTTLSINPTTNESRRGSFLRKNPHLQRVSEEERSKTTDAGACDSGDEIELQERWRMLEESIVSGGFSMDDMHAIVRLSDKQRGAWIPAAAKRLENIGVSASSFVSILRAMSTDSDGPERRLTQKLAVQLQSSRTIGGRSQRRPSSSKKKPAFMKPSLSSGKWKAAVDAVHGLAMKEIENEGSIISLPHSPQFVDTVSNLVDVAITLQKASVLGIDTEWCTLGHETVIATIQIATRDSAWVIDLLRNDGAYQKTCRGLVKQLFQKQTLLGFAFSRDISKLQEWLGESLPRESCLDLQLLWYGPQMKGLAACVGEFSSLPLLKTEQCSDWSRRPLSDSQLQYAGLDAAVLLYVLAEKSRVDPS